MNKALRKQYIKLILIVIFCILVLGLGFRVVYQINKTKLSVKETKERLASYQINKKAFNEETEQISSLEKRVSVLEGFVINNSSVPELLSKLESLAQEQNIKFEITSVQTIPVDGTAKLMIEFKTEGTYQVVTAFFDKLQHQKFQTKFKSMYIFSEEGSLTEPETSGTISVSKSKTPALPKELKWQGVATLEIVSFK